jgi:nitrate reductase NapE component
MMDDQSFQMVMKLDGQLKAEIARRRATEFVLICVILWPYVKIALKGMFKGSIWFVKWSVLTAIPFLYESIWIFFGVVTFRPVRVMLKNEVK